MQKLTDLKNAIQNEMEKIDKRYVNVDNETTQFYKEKRDKLNKEEEDLKEKLRNEVTKIKESFENNLSKIENLFNICKKIKKGILSLEKNGKNIIKTL